MDKNDAELVEKAKAGDTASFEALVKKYQDKIYGLANYVCLGLKSEADDVYQETFINAFKNISKFKGNSGFGTWLYRIAANNCWMKYRKRKSEKLVSIEDLAELKDLTHADEIRKKDDDPYDVDELILHVSLLGDADREEFRRSLNEELFAAADVSFNEINFVSREEIQRRIEIESAVKAKKIVDKRPAL